MENSLVQKNKVWRIGFFAFNNSASNALNTIMGYYALYTQNVLLLGAIMSLMVMPMRIFDGITDPIAGNLLDRLNTRFGRYRPFMVIGNFIMVVCVFAIFWFPSNLITNTLAKQIILVFLYSMYILGITLQSTATRAGQSLITGDPKQRPWYTVFDAIGSGVSIGIASFLLTGDLIGSTYDPYVWKVTSLILIVLSVAFTVLAVIGISTRDKPEFYSGLKNEKLKFREFGRIIVRNKPLRHLIYAASSDKLAAQLRGMMLFYFFSNVVLMSKINAIFSVVPGVLGLAAVIIGSRYAMKHGTTNAFVKVSWLEVISTFLAFVLCLIFIPVGTSEYRGINFGLILILTVYGFYMGILSVTSNLIYPMLGDITDYELLTSGKYIPGVIGSLFSFVDKLISSLAGLIVLVIMAISGFSVTGIDTGALEVPQNTYINMTFYYCVLAAVFLLPCLGHVITLFAMKNYPLTDERMREIAEEVAALKLQAKKEREV